MRIVTIDNYSIAAKQQIETYAEIMRIPVSLVESAEELRKNIALYQDTDLILVDTIGSSPRDLGKLAEMKEILAACGSQAGVYLALSRHHQGQRHGGDPAPVRPVRVPRRDPDQARRDDAHRERPFRAWPGRRRRSPTSATARACPRTWRRRARSACLMNMEGFRIDREALEERFNTAAVPRGSGGAAPGAFGGAAPGGANPPGRSASNGDESRAAEVAAGRRRVT